MMAALGGVAQHYIKFPGFDDVPAGLSAMTSAPGTYGFVALFVLSGVMELAIWQQDAKKEAGNFGDPVGFGQYIEDMRNFVVLLTSLLTIQLQWSLVAGMSCRSSTLG
jgi:hypothetical protein